MPAVLDQNSKLARNPKGMKGLMDPSFLNFSGDDEVETMLNSFKVRRKRHVSYTGTGQRSGMVTNLEMSGRLLCAPLPCPAIRLVPDSRLFSPSEPCSGRSRRWTTLTGS